MNVEFEKTQVPSIFSKPHHNSLTFKNFFPQGVGGSVKIVVDAGTRCRWLRQSKGRRDRGIRPRSLDDRTAASRVPTGCGAEIEVPVRYQTEECAVRQATDANRFQVEADERIEFSVYGEMEVGTEDLTLDVRSHLDKDGTLIVEQLMTNRSDRLADFKCHLRSKGHQPQRMQVYRLGRELDRKVYRIPDGRDLVGKEMLLEIEELNGPRILNYRFVASDQPTVSEESDAESITKSR